MDPVGWRERFASSRVAHLATIDDQGRPHIVPIAFAVAGDTIYFAVDKKPKRSADLKRLRNIAGNPRVAVLADHYQDNWEELWWVRADGSARVLENGAESARAIELLTERYSQYRDDAPIGPAVAIDVEHWSGWSFS